MLTADAEAARSLSGSNNLNRLALQNRKRQIARREYPFWRAAGVIYALTPWSTEVPVGEIPIATFIERLLSNSYEFKQRLGVH